jgi:SAM-dependent methyltransferase
MLRQLQPGARVLEIGCGTGQATLPLARAGLRVHALELGPALAELARANLSRYPNVTVETVAFEAYRADAPFDALVSVQGVSLDCAGTRPSARRVASASGWGAAPSVASGALAGYGFLQSHRPYPQAF